MKKLLRLCVPAILLTCLFSIKSERSQAQPTFINGASQTASVCENATLDISSLLAITEPTSGSTETWTITTMPTNGAVATGGTEMSTGSDITPSGFIYTPSTGFAGTDAITVTVDDGLGHTSVTSISVTVNALPVAGSIAGTANICTGATTAFTLTGADAGGTWSSSDASATVDASGNVTAVSAGTPTISYTVTTTGCGDDAATYTTTISDPVTAGTITGASSVCMGATESLTSDGTIGGTWSSSSEVAINALTGDATGLSTGTASITYAVSGACNSDVSYYSLAVNALPFAGGITGAINICTGSSAMLTASGDAGGTWTSSDATATVDASGNVTAVSAGTPTISYTVTTTGCGSDVAVYPITISDAVTAGPVTGAAAVCIGTDITLTGSTAGGSWLSSPEANIDAVTGDVTGVSAGTASITYIVTGGCNIDTAYYSLTVNAAPFAGGTTDVTNLCTGATTALLVSGDAGGAWSTTDGTIATVDASGNVSGVAPGTATISYIVSSAGCGSDAAAYSVIVSDPVSAGTISSVAAVCVGATTVLTTTGTTGGTWSSSPEATVDASGNVTGVTAGTANITYSVVGGCNTDASGYTLTVNALPVAGPISGNANICTGSTAAFTTAGDADGVWTSSDASATVDVTGVVTGVSVGTATISYLVTSTVGCGTDLATFATSVSTPVAAGTITGAADVCVGASTALVASGDMGGTWVSSLEATVDASGNVTGVTAGTAHITYTVTGCNTSVAAYDITINPLPVAGTITGASSVCIGGTSTFTTTGDAGGAWTSSDASATIDASGIVTGVSAGSATISYLVTSATGCGTDLATMAITTTDSVHAGTISGTDNVCVGSSIALTASGDIGGTWTSSSAATVDASGNVTGASAGTANVSYTVTGCNTSVATDAITVNAIATAGTISGSAALCTGSTVAFTASGDAGGTWTSSDASATVDASGNVTAASTGAATISYAVTSAAGCGSDLATFAVVITDSVHAGTISGASDVCVGASIALTTSGDMGGTWTSDAAATVDATGNVTGASAGTANVSYTVTGCNTSVATDAITINPLADAGTISGPATVCIASSISLSETTTGGTWSSTAEVSVDASGVVTGVSAGAATVSYTATNSCGSVIATYAVTVSSSSFPDAGTISGSASVCAASTITLSETETGGVWSSSDASATIDASGVVTGVSAGSTTISYVITTGCGTATATYAVTVNPLPNAGTITGASSVCTGATVALAASGMTGGAWSSSDASATVDASGVVSGVSAGSATISYIVTNSCGNDTATADVTINLAPVAGSITGTTTVCAGATTALANATGDAGGVWSSSDASATVTAAGVVTGVSAGSATISYTVSSSCGDVVATADVTVNPATSAGIVSGSHLVCVGFTTALADAGATAAGTWSSADDATATVDASGVVTGVAAGATSVSYSVTDGCGSAVATYAITVNSATPPTAGAITGASDVCIGSDVVMDNTTSSMAGTWSSSDNAIATVDATGDVTGVAAGSVTISYIVNTGCFADTATLAFTVNNVPSGGGITGAATVCLGAPAAYTDATGDAGGVWSSSDGSVATIDASGNLTSISAGTTTLSYLVTNTCGSSAATYGVTVEVVPVAGIISGPVSVCEGTEILLSDATATPGGVWSSSATANATVAADGTVTGVLAGTATISYEYINTCGDVTATYGITVNPQPLTGTITGPVTVCAGAFISLFDATGDAGGSWSSSDGSATVDPSGNVTGVSAGTPTISYSVTNMCGTLSAVYPITVNALPNAGAIEGPASVCEAATITLTNTTALAGGSWTSSNPANATVDASGVVTGVLNGSTVISYISANDCGTSDTATYAVTVNPLPVSGSITGTTAVCLGNTSSLADVAAGGTWTSSDNTIATVDASGLVTGVALGTADISYNVTNSCGSSTAIASVTVNAIPSVDAITGTLTVCTGATAALTETTADGVWTSSDATIATVDASGTVTGVAAGSVTITYTVTNAAGCSSFVTLAGTVSDVPVVAAITGATTVCVGSSITLIETTTGGAWTSSDNTIATVDATGVVTGVANGTATITYTATNAAGCSSIATAAIVSGTIFAPATLLPGGSVTLCDSNVNLTVSTTDLDVTYQWFRDGAAISGVTTSTYVASTPGVYKVVISRGCGTDTLASTTVLAAPAPVITVTGTTTLSTGSFTTYQWYFNGVAISGATASVHVATASGVYTVKVTDGNGCAVTSATDTVMLEGVPTVVVNTNNIRIYPNPATATVHIDAPVSVNVTILTTLGKIAVEQKNAADINISDLATGMYMIMIYDQNNNLLRSEKLIKAQ